MRQSYISFPFWCLEHFCVINSCWTAKLPTPFPTFLLFSIFTFSLERPLAPQIFSHS